jgi:flavin reductase (DIM6/NTAB) family NADH-FMN oxidoreductase RutF
MHYSYFEIGLNESHRLINHGPVVLVSTRNADETYDIAPVAWNCPASKDPPMLIVVVGREHRTYENIERTGKFIAAVPHESQSGLVVELGSVSGHQVNKFEQMDIDAFPGAMVPALVPNGCIGFLECKVQDMLNAPQANAILARVLRSCVRRGAFDGRMLVEGEAGKTLHHLGDKIFATPADRIIT